MMEELKPLQVTISEDTINEYKLKKMSDYLDYVSERNENDEDDEDDKPNLFDGFIEYINSFSSGNMELIQKKFKYNTQSDKFKFWCIDDKKEIINAIVPTNEYEGFLKIREILKKKLVNESELKSILGDTEFCYFFTTDTTTKDLKFYLIKQKFATTTIKTQAGKTAKVIDILKGNANPSTSSENDLKTKVEDLFKMIYDVKEINYSHIKKPFIDIECGLDSQGKLFLFDFDTA